MNNLQDILHYWENDLHFRTEFKKDPRKALDSAGIKLSEEELKNIEAALNLKKQKDLNTDLEKKVNK